MRKFSLVIEGVDPSEMGAWGYRIGTKRPGGEMHWIVRWLPQHGLSSTVIDEQCQVVEDLWVTMVKQFAGIQDPLPF